MNAPADILTPYRLRAVRIGVWATAFVVASLLVYLVLPGRQRVDVVPFLIVLAVASAGTAVMAVLPWPRLFASDWGLRMMYAWSALDIILIAVLIGVSSDTGREMFFLFTFTTVFFSVTYPRRAQIGLLALTFGSWMTVLAAMGWPLSVGQMTVRMSLLVVLSYFSRFLFGELRREMTERALENAHRFEEQRRTVERLAELDRLKSDFIATASHELRTPLTVIQGMGLTLQQQWDRLEPPLRRELLSRLNDNCATLDRIVDTLLDFARIESGRLEVRTDVVDIDELATSVVRRRETLLAGHALHADVRPGLAVSGDRLLLDRVLENLLANAVKHTPPGTAVRLSVRGEDGHAVVEVADTGGGIAPQDLRHLGSRFYRGGDTNTRPTGGTGLGLALVEEILGLHGSRLDVWTEVGRGSRFSFRLRLAGRAAGTIRAGASG